jgi:flagellar basal-body rod protein FlgC
MDLDKAITASAAGMKAQGVRLRVIAENLANANTTGQSPGDLPYRRKVVVFKNELDRAAGVDKVRAARIGVDKSDFQRRYDPTHPSADADGYVLLPNVNPLIEAMDMKEAERTYDANVSVIESSRTMLSRTIQLLKN